MGGNVRYRWRNGRGAIAPLLVALSALAGVVPAVDAGANGRKVVYLTFDDGPALDSATSSLLDLLAREGVTATFFVIGDNVDRNPGMIQRIIDGGHALGNHSDTHRPLNAMSPAEIRTEFVDAQAAVSRGGGHTMTCYRPPFGATSDSVRSIGASLGMSEEMWDLDIHDYERVSAAYYAEALERAGDGDVVLLHDGYTDGEMTVEAVRRFIDEHGDEIEFRSLPGCDPGSKPPTTGSTTTEPTTTSTTQPTTTTTGPTTTSTTSTTQPATTTTTTVETGDLVLPPAPCRLGPVDDFVDRSDPDHGAVFRIYCSHLGRQPDRDGFAYWLGIATESASLHPLSYSFLHSPEFVTTYGPLADTAFVTTAYANVLGRTPDSAGRDYWLALLADGVPRREVMLAFSESAEFRMTTQTA
ncbi:MAG: polysaccharide deacetylase family protein [Acidimicrobiales bacterium]